VARVLHGVAGRIEYQFSGEMPQEPLAVLRRGRAHCVGLSNLAVALLARLGIQARVARGLLFQPESGRFVAHRWIEVYYPDAGWAFSDPTESIHYVSAFHVLVSPPGEADGDYDPVLEVSRAPRLERIEDGLVVVDLRPRRRSRLAERRLRSVQYAATVLGYVTGSDPGTVTLSGGGRRRQLVAEPGRPFAFPGLEPGTYTLSGRFGPVATSQTVGVGAAELVQVRVMPP